MKRLYHTSSREHLNGYHADHIDICHCTESDYGDIVVDHHYHINDDVYTICCLKDRLSKQELKEVKDDLLKRLRCLYEPVLVSGSKKNYTFIQLWLENKSDICSYIKLLMTDSMSYVSDKHQNCSEYIQTDIIPNISTYAKSNAKRILRLWRGVYRGLMSNNWKRIENAVEQFIIENPKKL